MGSFFMTGQRYLTIKALTKYIKRKFDADPHLQDVYVKGEISNFKKHSSGHMYFTLKDENARIPAVMFARANQKLKFIPEDGTNVLVRGDITVYEPSGQYQIYVNDMQPDGIGDLFLAYEQLKEKLAKEGLFSEAHKREIPKYPERIGVITSPTGAAIRDILTTIERRYPIGQVAVFPALVQGERAGDSLVQALREAQNAEETVDVIIIGRGGGSIEELWAFNEEKVARAIFECQIPVISAVGHETDFTIADFVADLRAPTPTGAAELAVPHVEELLERVWMLKARLIRTVQEKLKTERMRLAKMEQSYAFRYPQRLYEQKLEQLDKLTERLVRNVQMVHEKKGEHFFHLSTRFELHHPRKFAEIATKEHREQFERLQKAFQAIVIHKQKDFHSLLTTLEALSPLKIMERGYSLVYTEKGKLIKSVTNVKKSDSIQIKLSDGHLDCEVKDVMESDEIVN